MSETIPGGYYIGADGKAHDANGKPLPLREDAPNDKAAPVDVPVAPKAAEPSAETETNPAVVESAAAKAAAKDKKARG